MSVANGTFHGDHGALRAVEHELNQWIGHGRDIAA